MSAHNRKSTSHIILEIVVTAGIVLTFILFTIVVIMLVTGTLHALNKAFFHFTYIKLFSVITAVIILFLSASFFLKAFKNIQSSVMKALLHNKSSQS